MPRVQQPHETDCLHARQALLPDLGREPGLQCPREAEGSPGPCGLVPSAPGTAHVSPQRCCSLGKEAAATPTLPAGACAEPWVLGVRHLGGGGAVWGLGVGELPFPSPDSTQGRVCRLSRPPALPLLRTEKPQARSQPCPSLLRPLQPGALASAPHPKLPPGASAGPELLPPSSFVPRGAGAPARVSSPKAWSLTPSSGLAPSAIAAFVLAPDEPLTPQQAWAPQYTRRRGDTAAEAPASGDSGLVASSPVGSGWPWELGHR